MAFTNIDATKPLGTYKVSTIDDEIRTLKTDIETNFSEISGYPNHSTIRQLSWTTSGRPSTNLVDGLTGYNTTLSSEEHYDLATTSWIQHVTATATIQGLIDAVVPIGTIMMWSGSIATIPTKWQLCNGTNGTIDLRNRFILSAGADGGTYTAGTNGVGTGNYAPGATGGEDKHQLTITELAAHTHSESTAGGNSGGLGSGGTNGTTTTTTGSTGGNTAHENRPPYYALAFIQRIS